MAYKQAYERNRRLKKLAVSTKNSYAAGVWYDEDKGYYVKFQTGRKEFRKYLRRLASRKARRYRGDLHNSDYRKVFDYWGQLY